MTESTSNLTAAAIEFRRDRESREARRQAEPWAPVSSHGFERANGRAHTDDWPAPTPLPDGLLPVAAFDKAVLPSAVAPWVDDIAERMQCPADFVAIPAMIALGSVLGRKIGIRPQSKTDWIEVPNLWGCIVGRPGAMKSPAMSDALRPLHRLEAEARKENEAAASTFSINFEAFKLKKDEAAKRARNAIKKGNDDVSGILEIDEPQEPQARRYILNDATYEALGEVLAANPNGVLTFRDELVSLLKTLDREEYAAARGFFLSAWSGTMGYTFDRIIRGKTHIDAACLSLLGSTQPARLAEYIRRASGVSDDGLIQRFGLLVWPDQSPEWRDVDRYPDSAVRATAWSAFERLDRLNPGDVGAERESFEDLPFLRFDVRAQGLFTEWRASLESRLRTGEMSPALESHLAKYRKLVPALALIGHLSDEGTGSVTETALLRALAFADYLETHARRAYAAGTQGETVAAKAILARIRKGELADGFTAREIQRRGWSNLADREAVKSGLDLLTELDWLVESVAQTGGRPLATYSINPEARR
jgi:Protein of unknown function (DUF3987)